MNSRKTHGEHGNLKLRTTRPNRTIHIFSVQTCLAATGIRVGSLVIQQKGKPPRSYELLRHTTIIGRGKDCGLILPDISVSRHHAQVVEDEEGFTIQDLGSQNGTSVNATRVSTQRLETGDVIQIGKFVLVYRPSPKKAEEVRATHGLDDYEVTGRTSYLEKVTALGGSNAHQTARV